MARPGLRKVARYAVPGEGRPLDTESRFEGDDRVLRMGVVSGAKIFFLTY
jgi:hypothetical protein